MVIAKLMGLVRTWRDVEKANPYYTMKLQRLANSGVDESTDNRVRCRRRCAVSAAACIPTGCGTGRCSCWSMPAKACRSRSGTNVFSPSVLAITHGHSDHVLGLPGSGRGAAVRQGRHRQAFDHRFSGRFPRRPGGARVARHAPTPASSSLSIGSPPTPGTSRSARQEQAARSDRRAPHRRTKPRSAIASSRRGSA